MTCRPSCAVSSSIRQHVHPLVPDGIFGPETAAAVRDFQRRNGLLVTGTAGYETWTAIYQAYLLLLLGRHAACRSLLLPLPVLTRSLAAGDKGPSVLVLQLLLSSAVPHFSSVTPVPLTGEYDRATADAVRLAQGVFLLPQNGVTDRATWEALALFHNSFFGRTPLPWLLAEL